jgi:hypothetical protein
MKIKIDSKKLEEEDKKTGSLNAIARYDTEKRTIILGWQTVHRLDPGCIYDDDEKIMDYFHVFIEVLIHESLHHVLNVLFDEELSTRLDNICHDNEIAGLKEIG